ncbi:MAG: hypothetical protein WC026_13345 [Hyphomicrobium sp.]|uniref:hypothetical protein n=1 Tax=Hyphomicrobium sp. TaxID=82 RepID=UPI00356A4C38
MKTHLVLDLVYHEEEGQGCFDGTEQECHAFIAQQGGAVFMYKVVPMTKEEIETHPDNIKLLVKK